VKELSEVDCIYFKDVAGMTQAKSDLLTYFVYPLIYPNLYSRRGAKSILLYGLPGTGKTFIAKAAVNELQRADPNVGVIFYAPTGAELKGKYVGETEKKIAAYFDCASKKANECGNDGNKKYIAVLFIDEIEAIAGDRTQDQSGIMTNSVNVLLQKMDGISSYKNVVVLAATNFPDKLDSAIRRRFAREIHISLPKPSDIQTVMQKDLASYAEPITEFTDKEKKDNAAPSNGCSMMLKSVCLSTLQREPFDNIGFDVTSQDLQEISEKLYLKNFSNSDTSRLVSYVINQAGNRALGGTFKPYSFKKSTQNIVYLSTFNKPKEGGIWTLKDESTVGPFVNSGNMIYKNKTYSPDPNTIKTYSVLGIQGVFKNVEGSGLLLVASKSIGPYTVWFEVPEPQPPKTMWLSSRMYQIVSKSTKVIFVKDSANISDRKIFVVPSPSKTFLNELTNFLLYDEEAPSFFPYNWVINEEDDDLKSNLTIYYYLKDYLGENIIDKKSIEESSNKNELTVTNDETVYSEDAGNIKKKLKTLYITKQDFIDAMLTVKSSIRDSEKKEMDKISQK
jgi:SpoVK/Ycf46/Vps4 family AAA+-type ATPase